ncbi:VOC family protein [Caulobacter sp. 17J80-11]|uniref:VOC family protein n=1 Tax=Caulobacter sp. 17J80-11 TaxID=2763502 RepID=UPI0016537BA8|nr:VOC family protein [Caulobacter sp. 17J80-11]MBC6982179.1 VOC family protein [Caulobacter sp. 17J80-11]
MLSDLTPVATVAVRDLAAAAKFYEDVLGLRPVDGGPDQGVIAYAPGGGKLFVYASAYAGTNQATTVTWPCGERLDALVAGLAARGVRFEHYDDLPDTVREGDVHVAAGVRVAWFKDPDGNIHSLVSG